LYFGADDDTNVVTVKELEQHLPLAQAHAVPGGLFLEVAAERASRSVPANVSRSEPERSAAPGLPKRAD
jgi:hypothetical protein